MKSEAGRNAENIGVKLSKALDVKFALLERLIDLLGRAKKAGELDKWVLKVKQDVLITQAGCSEAVADEYIKAALNRI